VVADLTFHGTTLRVGSLHLTSGGDRGQSSVEKDLEEKIFSRWEPNVAFIVGGDLNYDVHTLTATLKRHPELSLVAQPEMGERKMVTSRKRVSLLQPQLAKRNMIREGLLDNVFFSNQHIRHQGLYMHDKTFVRSVTHHGVNQPVCCFLPDDTRTLPDRTLGPIGRSDHLPLVFNVRIDILQPGGPSEELGTHAFLLSPPIFLLAIGGVLILLCLARDFCFRMVRRLRGRHYVPVASPRGPITSDVEIGKGSNELVQYYDA